MPFVRRNFAAAPSYTRSQRLTQCRRKLSSDRQCISVYLKNDLGFDVRVGKNAAKQFGYMSGRAEERAADLMEMFLSDEVRAIFCTGGGRTASQLLPLLDYDQIRQHPKISFSLGALSNPSIVANAITELHDFDEELIHGLAGVLAQISALIVGKLLGVVECTFPTDETLQDVVLRICAEYDFPILFGLDFGHTRDKLTLPLGLEAEFDSQRGELRIPQTGVV